MAESLFCHQNYSKAVVWELLSTFIESLMSFCIQKPVKTMVSPGSFSWKVSRLIHDCYGMVCSFPMFQMVANVSINSKFFWSCPMLNNDIDYVPCPDAKNKRSGQYQCLNLIPMSNQNEDIFKLRYSIFSCSFLNPCPPDQRALSKNRRRGGRRVWMQQRSSK